MEHIDLITRIVEAEQNARQIAEEALAKKQSLPETLDSAREELRHTHRDRAEKRIQFVRKREEDLAKEDLEKIGRHFEADMAKMESVFEQNRGEWVERLFTMVVGR